MTLTQIRQQPWYNGVAAAMNAQGVPEAIWTATMNQESGGDPTLHNDTPATGDDSYGLFQLNANGGIGAGLDPRNMKNPVYNARVAAGYMGPAIKSAGAGATPLQQLTDVEYAGWPGKGAAQQAEAGQRANWLSQMLAQGASTGNATGIKQTTTGSDPYTSPISEGNQSAAQLILGNPQAAASAITTPASGNPLTDWFTKQSQGFVFYVVVIIVILGGFLLISASVIGGGDAVKGAATVGKAAAVA